MSVDTLAPPGNVLHEQARQVWRQSVADGTPLTAEELGARFARSARWGRDRIAEVRDDTPTTPDPPAVAEPPTGPEPGVPAAEPAPPADADTPQPVAETIMNPAPADAPHAPAEVRQWVRLRRAVRTVLALGVAASIAGNVLHANGNLISQIIAAWSPIALLFTVELISRVPVHRPGLAAVRWVATGVIAGIAAWVSYWHMVAVAERYGETGGSQYLLPLSVDGLIVVASICLVELGGRIAATTTQKGGK